VTVGGISEFDKKMCLLGSQIKNYFNQIVAIILIKNVIFIIHIIFAAHEIHKSECMFPTYHQVFFLMCFGVISVGDDTVTGDRQLALMKIVSTFPTIIAMIYLILVVCLCMHLIPSTEYV
jgi:hypothetical protein